MADLRYQMRPLGQWTDPVTSPRQSSSVFRATWDDTLVLLRDEADHLDVTYPIVIQVDVTELDLRQDGMLRSRAQVGACPGVIVSFTSKHGPLRYASDAYDQRWQGALPGWQANVRAIALALTALRAVDRYGVTKTGQQYAGWRAIEAGNGTAFASADAALEWMLEMAGPNAAGMLTPGGIYTRLAKRWHPDVPGSDRHDWERLQGARQLLAAAGML